MFCQKEFSLVHSIEHESRQLRAKKKKKIILAETFCKILLVLRRTERNNSHKNLAILNIPF